MLWFVGLGITLAHLSAVSSVLNTKGWTPMQLRHPFCHICSQSTWWHELPIFYIFNLRKTCLTCQCASSSLYAIYIIVFTVTPLLMHYDPRAIAVMLLMASVIAVQDNHGGEVPILYIVALLISGVAYNALNHNTESALLGMVVFFCAGYVIALITNLLAGFKMVIGGGDLKLFGALGAWIGYDNIFLEGFTVSIELAFIGIGMLWILYFIMDITSKHLSDGEKELSTTPLLSVTVTLFILFLSIGTYYF